MENFLTVQKTDDQFNSEDVSRTLWSRSLEDEMPAKSWTSRHLSSKHVCYERRARASHSMQYEITHSLSQETEGEKE